MTPTDMTHKWNVLFQAIAQLAKESQWSELDAGQLSSLLGGVGLVQPFNWNAWRVPSPEIHGLWQLSEQDCIRHVTRIVRADRTNEGVLRSAVKSGRLSVLCTVALGHSLGNRMSSLGEGTN